MKLIRFGCIRCKHTSPAMAVASSRLPLSEIEHQALAPIPFITFRSALTSLLSPPLPPPTPPPHATALPNVINNRYLKGLRIRPVHQYRTRAGVCRPSLPLHPNSTTCISWRNRDCRLLPCCRSRRSSASEWPPCQDRLFAERRAQRPQESYAQRSSE